MSYLPSWDPQATLKARIGRKHVETMVSTSELGMTKGRVSRDGCSGLQSPSTCSFLSRITVPTIPAFLLSSSPTPQTLHQLTARAIIRDWTEGSLDSDKTEHEVLFEVLRLTNTYSVQKGG